MERQGSEDGSQIYNEFFANNKCVHRYRPGPKTFVKDLIDKWPAEKRALRRFFRSVGFADLGMGLIVAKLFMPQFVWKALLRFPGPVRWIAKQTIERTLTGALDDAGLKDESLRAALSAEFGDYGVVPDEVPFFLHAGILSHFMQEGGFSAVGGSDAFAEALVPTIVDAGGAVLVRATVEKIVVENGRAVGVEMKGGKVVVRARHSIISSTGVETTYRKLIPEAELKKAGALPASLVASERKGLSHHVYGFFGFEGTSKELDLPTFNVWSLPPVEGSSPFNVSAIWKHLFGSAHGEAPSFLESDAAAAKAQVPAFISFPSAKDSSYQARCPGKSSAVLITEAHADYFGEAGPHTKRGDEYAVVKKRYETVLLNALNRHFPHLRSKVAYVDIGTPLSNQFYLGRASSYGLDQDRARFLDPTLRVAVSGISSLYITGQDILVCGVFPQPITAWITLAKVLGVTSPDFWLLLGDFACSVGWRTLFDKTYSPALP
jgi:all-trans-retinol 13,14-reductase